MSDGRPTRLTSDRYAPADVVVLTSGTVRAADDLTKRMIGVHEDVADGRIASSAPTARGEDLVDQLDEQRLALARLKSACRARSAVRSPAANSRSQRAAGRPAPAPEVQPVEQLAMDRGLELEVLARASPRAVANADEGGTAGAGMLIRVQMDASR